MSALSKLYVAFVWHMHQPDYKDHSTGLAQMPWVRLHTTKDYVDMALLTEQFPKIRQTFNMVPSLIRQIQDCCVFDTDDPVSKIVKRQHWTSDDKIYMLERFFDASFQTMVSRSWRYTELFNRRNSLAEPQGYRIEGFSDQDYEDLAVLFNLVWFDPMWYDTYPDLKALWDRQQGYTFEDRQLILALQAEIIQSCLPTYKRLQDEGHIEITTTPYYHPILPLLIDSNSAKVAMPHITLPPFQYQHPEDAKYQVSRGRAYYASIFGHLPQGMWPSEQSISPDTLKLLNDEGVRWAISSEGNLARSLGIHFERDPYGHIQNVAQLCRPYRYENVVMLFRHLTLSDKIGFDYARWDTQDAVGDVIHRLKDIQQKCTEAQVPYPIVTIALDGENCWESYVNDGHDFLKGLYQALSEDDTLEVCRVCDYLDQVPDEQITTLNYLHSGSWIYDNFHIWIGDPVKNAAWSNLKQTRDDLVALVNSTAYQPELLDQVWEEIFIAEGSDWFWWFGEPHNSGQDDNFDQQFRQHLANVYKLLGKPVPNRLQIPLSSFSGKTAVASVTPITPQLSGRFETEEEWRNAGLYHTTQGAMHQANQLIRRVYYGSDHTHGYFRFEMNPEALSPYHQIMIYLCTPGKLRYNSPLRLKSRSAVTQDTQRYLYGYELSLWNFAQGSVQTACAEALANHLWMDRSDLELDAVYKEVLDVALPFHAFGIEPGDYLQFAIAVGNSGVLESLKPEHSLLSVRCFDGLSPVDEHFQRGGLGAAIY